MVLLQNRLFDEKKVGSGGCLILRLALETERGSLSIAQKSKFLQNQKGNELKASMKTFEMLMRHTLKSKLE